MSCGAEAAWIYQASKPNVNGAFVQVLENVACFATCSAHSFFCWREGVLNRYSCILILLEGLLLSVFHLTRALALCVLTRNRPWHMCGEFQYAALSMVCPKFVVTSLCLKQKATSFWGPRRKVRETILQVLAQAPRSPRSQEDLPMEE